MLNLHLLLMYWTARNTLKKFLYYSPPSPFSPAWRFGSFGVSELRRRLAVPWEKKITKKKFKTHSFHGNIQTRYLKGKKAIFWFLNGYFCRFNRMAPVKFTHSYRVSLNIWEEKNYQMKSLMLKRKKYLPKNTIWTFLYLITHIIGNRFIFASFNRFDWMLVYCVVENVRSVSSWKNDGRPFTFMRHTYTHITIHMFLFLAENTTKFNQLNFDFSYFSRYLLVTYAQKQKIKKVHKLKNHDKKKLNSVKMDEYLLMCLLDPCCRVAKIEMNEKWNETKRNRAVN